MLRVGLTGGLGSGKTTVAALLRELGCHVSDSDAVARRMMQPGEAVYREIVDRFGRGVVKEDGALDRVALARIAFHDGRVEELNSIVHPAVIAWQNAWMAEVEMRDPRAVAMVESALLLETRHGGAAGASREAGGGSWRSRFDCIVLVTAPEELRIARHVARYLARETGSGQMERSAAEADARGRMRAQLPDDAKAALADHVIRNAGTLGDLRADVERLWPVLKESSAKCFDRRQEAKGVKNASVQGS